MILKYNLYVKEATIQRIFKRIINQVYKLLPMRQEGKDWQKPLETLIEELVGLHRLIDGQDQFVEASFISLLAKLEGLLTLTQNDDFGRYRCTIFECLSLLNELKFNGYKNDQSREY